MGLSCFAIQLSFTKASDVAEKRLELKEESEKAKLPPVKEKSSFKRFDLLSALAVLGVLLVLLLESFFIFELYNVRFEPLERLLQPIERSVSEEADDPAPVELVEFAPADDETPAPVKTEKTTPVG